MISDNQIRAANIKSFYSNFSKKLIFDYVYGNPRSEAAICHAIKWIPTNSKKILDVGCGIGWSTWEIKRFHPESLIFGIDISEGMINIAKKLFKDRNITFEVLDIIEFNYRKEFQYECIVMLDIYEHIQKENRYKLYSILAKILKPGGFLILSFPNEIHQNFLRRYHPEGLQPIDEDVTLADINELANELNGDVLLFKTLNIWNAKDYVHVVVKRGGSTNKFEPETPPCRFQKVIRVEKKALRSSRVESLLKTSVTRSGLLLPCYNGPTICIISPRNSAYSETFISNHAERLPAQVKYLYGGYIPVYDASTKPIISPAPWRRLIRAVLTRSFNLSPFFFNRVALKKYLRRNKVDAVLAEYGPTGVSVMEACYETEIPLIVHFHGFDAYKTPGVKDYIEYYPRLFERAAALIVVSKDMERNLIRLGAPKYKTYYNPYGVDTSLFHGANPDNSPPIFLAVGRFVDKKAPYLNLLAFKKLFDSFKDSRLLMIGDGPLFESSQQLAKSLGIASNVEFLGVLNHSEIALIMKQSRAFIQHSVSTTYGDSEGTPVAILEACASGLPVISTRHAGIKETVIDGQTGFLVDEGDIESMAECMIDLAKNPGLAGRLGSLARKRIIENYNIDQSISKLFNIIKNTIKT